MAANVETMFYTRTKPWHGLGTRVQEAPDSLSALVLAGLDWRVIQKEVQTADGMPVPGFKANVRETDDQVLGIVTDRYKVVQNEDAFAFTDELLGGALLMRRQARCRAAEERGYWRGFRNAILSVGTKSRRIWYS